MRRTNWRFCMALLAGGLLASVAGAADLAVGSVAPAFRLSGSDGKAYALEDFVGTKGVVLAWFPKAFTKG
ncbi:MAG: redoxin domain-containing protein [Deltaproteobacteria bacterium]|nr:redoxin domain-containing protein [Deltaproteobacteria bacterium]MBW2392797.1 redoxin domain-containing protein [Deltaproteobacteria bacterium]